MIAKLPILILENLIITKDPNQFLQPRPNPKNANYTIGALTPKLNLKPKLKIALAAGVPMEVVEEREARKVRHITKQYGF